MRRFFFLKQNGKFVCITLILMFSKMIFNLLIFLFGKYKVIFGKQNVYVCIYFAYSNLEPHFNALQFTFSRVIKIILHWILSFKLMQYIVL